MKNKIPIVFFIFTSILFNGNIFLNKALAHTEGTNETSATRTAIEHTEEKVLGSEKHAELEKAEPAIDASVQKTLPLAIGGASLILLVIALYLKYKKKFN